MRFALWTIIVLVVVSVMTPLCPGQEPKATPGSPAQTKSRPRAAAAMAGAKIKVVDATPEDAFRTLLLGMIARDEAALRAVALPNPDLDLLLKGQVAPPEAIKEASAILAKLAIQRLKAGDKYTLSTGKEYAVAASEVGEDKAVLLPEGASITTRCKKVEGHWKVDAAPIIAAGRRAADAARKKADAKKAVPTKAVPKN